MSSAIRARAGSIALLALFFCCRTSIAAQADGISPSEAEVRAFVATLPAEELRWATIAAEGGQRDAQLLLGNRYLRGVNVAKDEERGVEWLRRAADQGSAPAQSLLGWIHAGGIEAKRDPAAALKWFTAAARQEDGYALIRLSEFYYRGIGVASDPARAKRLMLRAAELGDRYAIAGAWNLLLFAGKPEDRDTRLGLHYLVKGANADDPHSAYTLGREYLTGRDVPRDPARAAQWLVRAAKNKHALASLWLSELHAKGLGVPQNSKRAEQMLEDALRAANIRDKNDFSWTLSVTPDAQLRNAALAIRVLEPALAAEKQKSAAHLDTLAAAYAEHGQFDKAVATQLEALETLRRARPTDSASQMQQRLELYRTGKSYREETL
jgi:TPR repeat protein